MGEAALKQMALTSADCAKLMPDGSPDEAARIAELEAHFKALEVEQASAEAKHRLYTLLHERTKCAGADDPSLHPLHLPATRHRI